MNKELQDHVWSVLPKEFKEEVKKRYKRACQNSNLYSARGTMETLELLFGYPNLTSDAEGDEMLTVSRKKVQEKRSTAYRQEKSGLLAPNSVEFWKGYKIALDELFGSKCMPDANEDSFAKSRPPKYLINDKVVYCGERCVIAFVNPVTDDCERTYRLTGVFGNIKEHELTPYKEPKPAEPKFKRCEKVITPSGELCIIEDTHFENGRWLYLVGDPSEWISESDLELYTEPKNKDSEFIRAESVKEVRIADEETHLRNFSQEIANCDKHHIVDANKMIDNIIKDGFSKERRCNIAVQMVKALTQSSEIVDRISSGCDDGLLDGILHDALYLTDKLIAECEKGGEDGES